ncbi:MAG: adenylyltransferase/cytidyltransferase family protein [Burkholderiales bacterium]|nr:adenylyltransferase/cytidyltransferase family protein [Burkholderiales bacterium]
MSTELPPPAFESKIVPLDRLAEAVKGLKKPVVFTNGVFDILHRGHVTYLAQARALGGSLVVAMNSDRSVKMLGKGDDRPINTQEDSAAVLAALESVSLVTVFDDKVPLKAVELAHPDIYVKGGDYLPEDLPEGKIVSKYGGKIVTVKFAFDRSTTKLLDRVRQSR